MSDMAFPAVKKTYSSTTVLAVVLVAFLALFFGPWIYRDIGSGFVSSKANAGVIRSIRFDMATDFLSTTAVTHVDTDDGPYLVRGAFHAKPGDRLVMETDGIGRKRLCINGDGNTGCRYLFGKN